MVVPVDLTMMAVFCKSLPSVHHVGLSGAVHHVVLFDALFGEVELCVVWAAVVFVTAWAFGAGSWFPLTTLPSLGIEALPGRTTLGSQSPLFRQKLT